MNITDIRIRHFYADERLKALVSITIDNDFAVHDIKIIQGASRLFVAMPSRKDDKGNFRDIVHPITAEARQTLETAILKSYKDYISSINQTIEQNDSTNQTIEQNDFTEN